MQRGRKSNAALSVASSRTVQAIPRPGAPTDLNLEEKKIWLAIVTRMPADWFQVENYPLLKGYCRHVAAADEVAAIIEAFKKSESFDLKDYDILMRIQRMEVAAASSLATRMRLSQQSTYDPKKRKGDKCSTTLPWESNEY